MALKQISESVYELALGNKVYRVVFSIGVKDLLFRAISDSYSKYLLGHPEASLIPQEHKAKYFELNQQLSTADKNRSEELQAELKDLIQEILIVGQQESERQQDKVERNMRAALDEIKYSLWSILLTQRTLEGQISEYVSPERVKHSEEFASDEALEDLTKLFDASFARVQQAVKKSLEMSQRVQDLSEIASQSLTP